MAKRSYTVRAGDSLLSVAVRELGNAELASEIAYINAMGPRSLTGPLTAGSVILLPEPEGTGAGLDVTVRKALPGAPAPNVPPWGTYAVLAAVLMLVVAGSGRG